MVNIPTMQHRRKQPKAGKARRTRLGIVFADGSAMLTALDGAFTLVEACVRDKATR